MALFTAFSTLALTTTVISGSALTAVAAAQVTPLEDEPDEAPGLGRITGSPEPGPKPEDAGDRGGWAQLALAVIMLGGVAFIGLRITSQVRGARPQNVSDVTDV